MFDEGIARAWARITGWTVKARSAIAEALRRRRVPIGFLCGAVVFGLAQPTALSISVGMSIAAVGELLRIWAAGHVNKAREVTVSGPYRWLAHPLYVGSSIMGAGLAVACASVAVAVLIGLYLSITLPAAIGTEEAFLRRTFADEYDRWRRDRSRTFARSGAVSIDTTNRAKRFSLGQAIANHEHRAILGLLAATALLLAKATFWQTLDRR